MNSKGVQKMKIDQDSRSIAIFLSLKTATPNRFLSLPSEHVGDNVITLHRSLKICVRCIEEMDPSIVMETDDVELSSSLATTTPEEHDQEIENEEGEYVWVRNLSKSKWEAPRIESNVTNSSPEGAEFKQQGFEKNDEASSSASNVLGIWPRCRNVFEFERLGKISEGTYGVVYKARVKRTGDDVALKKVKVGSNREGFPVTTLREIKTLGVLQHPSLIEMKEVVIDDFDDVYIVMEYVDHELKGYMERMRQPFNQSEVKRLMVQLLEGVSYLHYNYVMPIDLKTSNLLLNNNGELKICDFGLSQKYASPHKPYTPLVVTLWYRAPELLLGMKSYSTAIDMWSVGCVMAELLSKKPLFDGRTELEQIDKIFRTLGTPNELIWPAYSKLMGVKPNFVKQPYNNLRKKFPVAVFMGSPMLTELGFDLLNKFLNYDPEKRITAKAALDHGWFREAPLPAERLGICK
ncbi:hypothetical protein L1987_66836 [Smallanthus sonchifolius]|uniref:Uncharacterized protein n=1 Tax=Smallanthus sonchifolius TaxID=185202 RepID=A0ACB9BYJ0_9ASTR|nr:hypothetical protein L1987_66836 [Smallanthus sonchifolius]